MEQTLADFLSQYGYIGIILFLIMGIVGIPLPDEIFMTFIGYLSSEGQLNLYLTYFSALTGSIGGITLSYALGKRFGYPLLKRYGSRLFITRRRLRITQFLFRKYGNWVLFFGYFIPGVRHLTAYIAGISKLSYTRFGLYAYCGAIVWCGTFIGLGYVLGSSWELVFHFLHRLGPVVLLALILIGGFLAWYWWSMNQNGAGSRPK
jgi:membrane protein DedA with SNARE-associated domain